MKLVKTANGKRIKMSQEEWEEIGKKAGWMKTANIIGKDFGPNLAKDPSAQKVQKKAIPLPFEEITENKTIQTKEGPVGATAGDILMTGTEGEQWPIPGNKFRETYDVVGEGRAAKKAIPVFAKQMREPFSVKVSWSEDLLNGSEGDWLVEYGPNDYGVVGASIFKETYSILGDQ